MAKKLKHKKLGKNNTPKYIKSRAKLANIIKLKNTERIVNCVIGCRGSGKTQETKNVIKRYIKEYPKERVLIIDPNEGYTEYPTITVKDITKFKKPSRICLFHLNDNERKDVLENISWYYKNGLLVFDDFSSIIYHDEIFRLFISAVISCRSKDIDVILTFQGISYIPFHIIQNTHAYRFHRVLKDKIPDIYFYSNKYGDIPINYITIQCNDSKEPIYPFVYFDANNQKIISVNEKNYSALLSACVKHLSPMIDELCNDVVYGKN